ncbi:3-keto-disaccharide hydrolase [Subtercola frigoramans]|uniref:3-keto-alpha-glucoside-1,2-lyase/3-keto-2-hydroxy-glucal hydratase domain-containing protein n=1 Tax=Subtercola frigoramans TaxID=120298 RepID=A0ABS2L1P0_9MICO|nr:DUF1080 domain-containing protein [Subtercola frigoramans]MBM7471000.1 hypothetical protein [Subtercola frigoramans]
MTLTEFDDEGFRPLFDGSTLAGWHTAPRIYGDLYPGGPAVLDMLAAQGARRPVEPEKHPAVWTVEDGAIVGRQDAPGSGYGGYLVSDESYGDFELVVEAKPDWPADTGVMIRRRRNTWEGFQVLVDHRESGGIGGFFGNGLASFSAVPFAVRGRRDASGEILGLEADDPSTSLEPVTPEKIARLRYAADVNDFLRVWKWADWNEIRIRAIGALPVITTWVNGLKIAEVDTATLDSPDYDAARVLDALGDRGHIALEVHDSDLGIGGERWGHGAACRWRNIRIKTL